MATCPIPIDQMSAATQRAANPTGPKPARMMAARGLAPMAPRDLVTAQFALTFDPDPQIAEAAAKSLGQLDDRIAKATLSDTAMNPFVLDYLAERLQTRDALLEQILLNQSTPDTAFIRAAESCSEKICDIICLNQARLLQAPEIARSLVQNPNALKSTIDRAIDFLVRNSVILDGVAEFDAALLRLTGQERVEAAAAVEIPPELLDKRFAEEATTESPNERRIIVEDDDMASESEEEERLPPEKLVKGLTTGQKVAFATKGNKQIRNILIRDTNRIVALAAITAPAVTEIEVLQAAQSRTVHQDVIAHIARTKDYLKNYGIKIALAGNPKTPLPTAMKLIPTLHRKDLKQIERDKNVPLGVRNLARKLNKARNR